MPAPASAPKRPTEIIVSCDSSATATPTGARSRRIGAGRMLIRTVNITHSAPERTWKAPPETDVACIVASTCTTHHDVKRSVGMAREPSEREHVGDRAGAGDVFGHTRSSAGAAALHERKPGPARRPAGRAPRARRAPSGRAARGRERCRTAAAARTRARGRADAGASGGRRRVPRPRTRSGRGRACAAPSARRARGRARASTASRTPSSASGSSSVSSAATAFRNGGWSVSPTGSER